MRVCASVVLMFALLAPAAAREPSVAKVFEQFGLFGTWAIDCERKPSPDNPRVTVFRPSGAGPVTEKDDAGPGTYVNRYTIVSARPLTDNTVRVEVRYRVGKRQTQLQEQIWFVRAGNWRTLFNKPKGESARVKDGVVVGSGAETPVLHKCSSAALRHQAARPWRIPRSPE